MLVTTKICTYCGEEKNIKEFYKQKRGFTPRCSECLRMIQTHWRKIRATKKKEEKKFPQWICSKCKSTIQLDFDPLKDTQRWFIFQCPKCNQNVEA